MTPQGLEVFLSGFLMDNFQRTILFPYAALFVLASFVTMFFVKHGDAQVVKKDSDNLFGGLTDWWKKRKKN